MATIDGVPIGVATATGMIYSYVLVYDKRDLSRECFRVPLKGGAGKHVDWSAMPETVQHWFADAMAVEDSRG